MKSANKNFFDKNSNNLNVLPFSQVELLVTQLLHEKKLTRETNGFFNLSKSQKYISLQDATQLAFNWREITKDFLFTVLMGIGVFAGELRRFSAPERDLIDVLQTEVAVISDDLSNVFPTLKEVAPQGASGSHYIWWEESIANILYAQAKKEGLTQITVVTPKVQKLLDSMLMLSKHKLGAAVQLRIVESIAQEIALSYRALFVNMHVNEVKLFPNTSDLMWVNAHIKAEVIHHRQVKDSTGGVSNIAITFHEQQEFIQLTEQYIEAWAGALEDFETCVRGRVAISSSSNFAVTENIISQKNATKLTRKWQCIICDLIYDESIGFPEHGIEPGTAFEDIPNDWVCPDCGVGKSDFALLQDNKITQYN